MVSETDSRLATTTAAEWPRYLLRKCYKAWRLVFNGMEAVLKDSRGMALVAYLLLNPAPGGIHGVNLAARATGHSVVQEGSLEDQGQRAEAEMKRVAKECLEVIHDPTAAEGEKMEAQTRLDALAETRKSLRRRTASNAEKVVRSVRRAIERLITGLRTARGPAQAALRAFGEHLHQHLWIPSARYGGSRRDRLATGTAGQFTYEPPPGVQWHS